jgi:hypothetical protein
MRALVTTVRAALHPGARASIVLALACLLCGPLSAVARADTANAERAALIGWQGYAHVTPTAASIPTTAGGTAVVTTALTNRHKICIYVLPAVTATIYISTGTPSATAMVAAITGSGDRMWCEFLPSTVTVKALSSSGTVAVYVSEFAF